MVVARAGERADPPVPAPAALRPFTNFTRLNDRVAGTVRRVLEADDDFRTRVRDAVVASSVDEEAAGEAVGAAGWLLLDRPEGWEQRLAALLDEAVEAQARADRTRDERRHEKRRAQAETALEAMRAELAEVEERGERQRGDLEAAREDLATLRAELERNAVAGQRLADERAEAVRQLEEARRTVEERAEERRALRRAAADAKDDAAAMRIELAHLHAELEAARSLPLFGGAAGGVAGRDARPERPAADADADAGAAAGDSDTGGAAETGDLGAAVRDELAGAVTEAAAAAAALGAALARAGSALEGSPAAGAHTADGATGTTGSPGAAESEGPGGAAGAVPDDGVDGSAAAMGGGAEDRAVAPGRGGVPVRRQPARLPVGLFDDSVEAADHLTRIPGAVLIVDGYNVSLGAWPDLALAQQRRRLVEALRNLQARTGVEPVAVFDGGEVDSGPTGSLPRSVQVRFSPPGVTADDLVVDLVGHHPNDRAVVVATSDRELQDRARAIGANVIASPQLVGLLRV